MKKNVLFILLSSIYCSVYAQVGIGTDTPKATLDIEAANKTGSSTTVEGIIIPRVDRERAQRMTGVVKSTIIYVDGITTGGQTGSAININTEGFYTYNDSVWVKMPDATQISDYSYWKAQAVPVSTPKNQENNQEQKSLAVPGLVEYNIFQKGKVGIGYNKEADVDFKINTTLKQLEVGGDFRTVYTDTKNKVFLGIETNSLAMPGGWSPNGNLIYASKNKNIGEFLDGSIEGDGSLIIQDNDRTELITRKGIGVDFEYTDFGVMSSGLTSYAYKAGNPSKKTLDKLTFFYHDYDKFIVANNLDTKAQFGIDFTKGNFFIGDFLANQTHYYFPNEKPVKDAQILKYNNASQSLEWADAATTSASPSFFYMPSVVLPTTPSGVTTYVTYNTNNQTYTVDLYAIYSAQFGTSIKSSNGNTNGLAGFVLNRDKYEYHIIYADENVFPHADIIFSTVSGEEGKFTYKVDGNAIVRNGSFMNIVLKVK